MSGREGIKCCEEEEGGCEDLDGMIVIVRWTECNGGM